MDIAVLLAAGAAAAAAVVVVAAALAAADCVDTLSSFVQCLALYRAHV